MGITAPSSGLPLLMTIEEDSWTDIRVDLSTLRDGTNDRDWNCYFATVSIDDEEVEDSEIPFWAMKSFFEWYSALPKKARDKVVDLEFRRKIVKGKNQAEFR